MSDILQEAPVVLYEPPSKGIQIIIDEILNIKNRVFPFEVNIKVEFMGEIIGELNDVKVENEESTQIGSEIYYKITGPVTTELLDDLTANPFLITVAFKGDVPDKKAQRQKRQSQKSPKLSKKANKSPKSSKTSKEGTTDLDKQQDIKMEQYFGILGQTNLDILPLLMGNLLPTNNMGSSAVEIKWQCIPTARNSVLKLTKMWKDFDPLELEQWKQSQLGRQIIAEYTCETRQTEVLILESPQRNTGSSITVCANLPQLMVSAEPIAGTMEGVTPNNILYFTLEAMYNVMPELLQPGATCEVYTALPLVGQTPEEYTLVTFTKCEIKTSPISENKKRWFNLSHIAGRSAVSKYRLNDDILDIKNTVHVNLNEKLNALSPRLEWNILRRCWIQEATQKDIFNKLMKYRCWPVEFKIKTMEPKRKASPKKAKNKEKKEMSSEEPINHFIAFLDISNLLYPGVTQTRVTGQLYTYTDDEMKQKFGREYAFTSSPPPLEQSPSVLQNLDNLSTQRYQYDSRARVGTKDKHTLNDKSLSRKSNQPSRSPSKDKSPRRSKSKGDEKASSQKERIKSTTSRSQKLDEIQPPEQSQEKQVSVPVFTDDGQPVFIIVEIQLEKPLKEKHTREEIKSCISELIPPRPEPDPIAVSAQMAEINYKLCIHSVIDVIKEEYDLFASREAPQPENIEKNFLMHLHQTGGYKRITELLRESIIVYVRNKIGAPKSGNTECEYQNYIQQTYLQLVEEMFRVVNSLVDGRPPKHSIYDPGVTVDNLYYYAVEAWEESNNDRAKVYLLEHNSFDEINVLSKMVKWFR